MAFYSISMGANRVIFRFPLTFYRAAIPNGNNILNWPAVGHFGADGGYENILF